MATNVKYKVFNGTSWEELIFPVASHSHSEYAPKASPTFTGTVDASGATLKIKTINAPTSSGGTTYGAGTSGYVLKSNGSTIYWASDSSNSNYYPIRSYTSGLQISSYSGSTNCQLYVPNATDSQAGVVTTGSQTFAGYKTFKGTINPKDNIYFDYEQQNQICWEGEGGITWSLQANLQDDPGDDVELYLPIKSGHLGLEKYRHAIKITSSAWGTSTTSTGSTTRTLYLDIINDSSTLINNITKLITAIRYIGATSLDTSIFINTATTAFNGGNCIYASTTYIVNGYKSSNTATTFSYYYLLKTALATISDTVTSIS